MNIHTVNKKKYITPKVERVMLDYSISLQMASQPVDPPPRTDSNKGNQADPFASPFGDKPFG